MALSATVNWDVRSGGNDANGGGFDPGVSSPGTDYSQQNAAQIAFTDLVIGGTNTQLTSVANPFTSAHVGNLINITGGAGFTTGWYTVTAVAAGVATMDRAVGTSASTAGTGNLGGGLATLGQVNTNMVSGNIVWCSGTFTFTSSLSLAQATVAFVGYTSTHGDGGRATWTTSTNSTTLINTGSSNGGIQSFSNLVWSNTAATPDSAIWQLSGHGTTQAWQFNNCKFTGFTIAVDSSDGTPDDVWAVFVNNCEFSACEYAIRVNQNPTPLYISGCYFHGNTTEDVKMNQAGYFSVTDSIFYDGVVALDVPGSTTCLIENCVFYGYTSLAVDLSSTTVAWIQNSVFWANEKAINGPATFVSLTATQGSHNAYGDNTLPSTQWNGAPSDVALSVDPFVSASGGNFALNTTSGGGADLAGAGFPGTFGSSTTNVLNIGAVQGGGGGGGAVANSGYSS